LSLIEPQDNFLSIVQLSKIPKYLFYFRIWQILSLFGTVLLSYILCCSVMYCSIKSTYCFANQCTFLIYTVLQFNLIFINNSIEIYESIMIWIFYIECDYCSYFFKQGTSRPTHYHVLFDEIGFSADNLQELVHSLCYV
jgi:hypothetical protein